MRKIISVVIILLLGSCGRAQQVSIIPQPASLKMDKGRFTLHKKTVIVANDEEDRKAAHFFNNYLQETYGWSLETGKAATNNFIRLTTRRFIKAPGKDAYSLHVDSNGVHIEGDTYAGTFYGIQTLIQLLPVEPGLNGLKDSPSRLGRDLIPNPQFPIPALTIQDTPRFQYRGMHLDVGRHFFPVSFIKKYIDYIALHKMNYFHWHLTEDQGWRIEIKKYPELTRTGSCRNGTIIGRYPGRGNDNIRYCGYYTQNEIKDIVQYAADRHITILPEIDLPGHSSAALASYPWLGCPGTGPYKVQETWGVFNDVYCAGKDTVFRFLQNVLDEVMELFPSGYIHIGGDECPKTNWKKCPLCQKRIKDEGLKDEKQLQSYFIRRIEKYVNGKGRNIVGWDEILEGGLAPNATVMSWRGEKGGIEAARQAHFVIMTPEPFVYLDQAQKLSEDSVTIGRYLPVEKVYGYEPVPQALTEAEASYIKGAQGNAWTEYMKNPRKVEYQVFPRMSALSEVLWSPKEKRNWNDFEKRLRTQIKRYQLWKANYSTAYYDTKAIISPAPGNKGLTIKLESNDTTGKITYRIEGKAPERSYSSPILIREDTRVTVMKKGSFTDSLVLDLKVNKATGKIPSLSVQPLQGYQGNGTFTLADGITNKMGLSRSNELLGFRGSDVQAVFDLDTLQQVSNVVVHTLRSGGSRIYPIYAIEVLYSADGKNFTSLGNSDKLIAFDDLKGKIVMNFSPVRTRYIRVVIQPLAKIPEGRPGAGENPLFFIDEIEIN